MSEQEIKLKIKNILIKELKLKCGPETIGDEERLFGSNLGLDSVDILTLVNALEDGFGIQILDDEIAELNSVNTFAAFIQRKSNQAAKMYA